MLKTVSLDFASRLPAGADEVWARISTPEGINAELWPIRMHLGGGVDSLNADYFAKRPVGILISLFGFVPFDWHRLGLESVTPGRGFREVSTSLWMQRWVHARSIEPNGASCVVHDHVELTPRLAFLTPLVTPIYRGVFRRRHRQLQKHFGGGPAD